MPETKDQALVAALRACVTALGLRHEGVGVEVREEIVQHWPGCFELPSAGQPLLDQDVEARARHCYRFHPAPEQPVDDVLSALETLSTKQLAAVFKGLPPVPNASVQEVFLEDGSVALSDEDQRCPFCGHQGLTRTKQLVCVALQASEAQRKVGLPIPTYRTRSVERVFMNCAGCSSAWERTASPDATLQARAELIADRLNNDLAIDSQDLRGYLQDLTDVNGSFIASIWDSIEQHLIDVEENNDALFFANPDAPTWVHGALGKLECVGQVLNVHGDIYQRLPAPAHGDALFPHPSSMMIETSQLESQKQVKT